MIRRASVSNHKARRATTGRELVRHGTCKHLRNSGGETNALAEGRRSRRSRGNIGRTGVRVRFTHNVRIDAPTVKRSPIIHPWKMEPVGCVEGPRLHRCGLPTRFWRRRCRRLRRWLGRRRIGLRILIPGTSRGRRGGFLLSARRRRPSFVGGRKKSASQPIAWTRAKNRGSV